MIFARRVKKITIVTEFYDVPPTVSAIDLGTAAYPPIYTVAEETTTEPESPREASRIEQELVKAAAGRLKSAYAPNSMLQPFSPEQTTKILENVDTNILNELTKVGEPPKVFKPTKTSQQFPLPMSPTIAGRWDNVPDGD